PRRRRPTSRALSIVRGLWAPARARLAGRQKLLQHPQGVHVGLEHGLLLAALVDILLAQADDGAQSLNVEAVALGLGIDVADIVGSRLLFLLKPLDALDNSLELVLGEAGSWLIFFGGGYGGHRTLLNDQRRFSHFVIRRISGRVHPINEKPPTFTSVHKA